MPLTTYKLEYGKHIVQSVIAIVHTCPQALLPGKITMMRKSYHGFSLLSYKVMVLCLAGLQAARASLQHCHN